MQNLKQKKSLLIINMGTIGDILMSTPVASAFKNNNSNIKITWIVQPELASLLDGNPYIDHLIPWDYQKLVDSWYYKRLFTVADILFSLKKQLKNHKFDIALDLQGVLTSGFVTWFTGATHRIALGSEEGSNLFMTKTISRTLGDRIHLGSEYRYLITQLGIPDKKWEMFIPSKPLSTESARRILEGHIGSDKYAVICPFTNRESKRWNDAYWQQIILRIRGRYQLRSIILGGENESEMGKAISSASGAVNLSGKTSLLEAAEIIRGAEFVVGVDTGLTHMAHAAKVPTLALFGPTFPYAYAGQEASQVIHTDRYCSPCNYTPTCNNKFNCMQDISPDRVLTEIKPIMQEIIKAQKV